MKFLLNFLIFGCFIALTTQPAHAYLDPGTGSMVVQILIACFATVAIFFKSMWNSIKGFFCKTPKAAAVEDEDDDE